MISGIFRGLFYTNWVNSGLFGLLDPYTDFFNVGRFWPSLFSRWLPIGLAWLDFKDYYMGPLVLNTES
jgi:hypothetical protein